MHTKPAKLATNIFYASDATFAAKTTTESNKQNLHRRLPINVIISSENLTNVLNKDASVPNFVKIRAQSQLTVRHLGQSHDQKNGGNHKYWTLYVFRG